MRTNLLFAACILFSSATYSEVRVNIIDTGPGLAVVISLPDEQFVVFDTGHWNESDIVLAGISAILPEDAGIDIIVLSHSDSDHIAATDEILEAFPVGQVIRTGLERNLPHMAGRRCRN